MRVDENDQIDASITRILHIERIYTDDKHQTPRRQFGSRQAIVWSPHSIRRPPQLNLFVDLNQITWCYILDVIIRKRLDVFEQRHQNIYTSPQTSCFSM